jgi:hypothetical protein
MKKLLVILFVGAFAASANAATLWMEFDDGPGDPGSYPTTEVTLMPSETAVLSIYIDLIAGDTLSGASGQFEDALGLNVEGAASEVVDPEAPKDWRTGSAYGPLGVGFGQYSASYFAYNPLTDSLEGPGRFLLAEVEIHQLPPGGEDYEIAFYHNPEAFSWRLKKGNGTDFSFYPAWASYSGYFTYGQGSPGASVKGGGESIRDPLLLHCIIPEPSSIGLLILGSLAALRRRR